MIRRNLTCALSHFKKVENTYNLQSIQCTFLPMSHRLSWLPHLTSLYRLSVASAMNHPRVVIVVYHRASRILLKFDIAPRQMDQNTTQFAENTETFSNSQPLASGTLSTASAYTVSALTDPSMYSISSSSPYISVPPSPSDTEVAQTISHLIDPTTSPIGTTPSSFPSNITDLPTPLSTPSDTPTPGPTSTAIVPANSIGGVDVTCVVPALNSGSKPADVLSSVLWMGMAIIQAVVVLTCA